MSRMPERASVTEENDGVLYRTWCDFWLTGTHNSDCRTVIHVRCRFVYVHHESPSGRGPCTGYPSSRTEERVMGRRSTDALAIALATLLLVVAWTGVARAQAPVASDFQKVTLDDNTQNPMELDVAPDGRVFYIERDGRLMIWKP